MIAAMLRRRFARNAPFDAAMAAASEAMLETSLHGAPLRANAAYLAFAESCGAASPGAARLEELADGRLAPAVHRAHRALSGGAESFEIADVLDDMRAVDLSARLVGEGGRILWRLVPRARRAQTAEARDAPPFAASPIGFARIMRDPEGAPRLAERNPAFDALFPKAAPDAPLADCVAPGDREAFAAFLDASGATDRALSLKPQGREDEPVSVAVAERGPEGVAALFAYEAAGVAHPLAEDDQGLKLQALGRLAGGVAHDFNNVLQAIMGFCDLLLARHPVGDPSHADLMQIKQNATRAGALVRQLLAFSRAQELQLRAQHFADVIADIADLLRRLLGAGIELRLTHGSDVPPARFDETQLEMAIMNLAVNARDAMPSGGVLRIATARRRVTEGDRAEDGRLPPGDYAVIRMSDEGEGMPPEVRERVFEPFFTTKGVGKGTGLGLATVYGIVQQSGGHIFLDSEVGRGTTFRLYFPAAEIELAPAGADAAKRTDSRDLTGRGRILLVEDEDAVRAFTTRALESRGYEVLAAGDGEEALALLQDGAEVDLVVTDVMMPAMDGPAFVVAAGDLLKDVRILFVSGYGADAVRAELPDDARLRFLAKPFSLKDLAEAVKRALEEA